MPTLAGSAVAFVDRARAEATDASAFAERFEVEAFCDELVHDDLVAIGNGEVAKLGVGMRFLAASSVVFSRRRTAGDREGRYGCRFRTG
jgi:hypothetical protein